jgi:hypothetical protein
LGERLALKGVRLALLGKRLALKGVRLALLGERLALKGVPSLPTSSETGDTN